jgi:hypothetical protein
MRSFILSAILLSSAIALPGCGNLSNTSPTGPSTIDLTGTWSGAFVVQGSAATMTWTLTEASGSNAVAGPIFVALADGTVLLNGALSGTLSGTTLTFAINVAAGGIPSQPSCTGQLGTSAVAAIAATSTLSGTLTVVTSSCPAPIQNGPFVLAKS